MKIKLAIILLSLFAFLLASIGNANAHHRNPKPKPTPPAQNCRAVVGNIIEFVTNPSPLATKGDVTGNLRGAYIFRLVGDLAETKTPGVFFFNGVSSIKTDEGTLFLTEAGALDTKRPGNFSDLMTITGGKDGFKGASGQIHFYGHFDGKTGVANGDIKGTVCVPISH